MRSYMLDQKVYEKQVVLPRTRLMTVRGTIKKTMLLFALLGVSAFAGYFIFDQVVIPWMSGSPVGRIAQGVQAFALAIILGSLALIILGKFYPQHASIIGPLYAVLQSLLLTPIVYFFSFSPLGKRIFLQSMLLTVCVVCIMLALYAYRIIRVTRRLRSVVTIGMITLACTFCIDMIMRLVGYGGIQLLHTTATDLLAFGFSLLVIGFIAFSIMLQFDFIERQAKAGVPAYMEWYSAFGLLILILGLFMRILRLRMERAMR